MRNNLLKILALFLLSLALIFSACGGGGGDDDNDAQSLGGITPVNDQYKAGEVVCNIAEKSIDEAIKNFSANYTFNKTVVNGITGTATITGSQSYQTSSTSNCVSSTGSKNFSEVIFNNYQVKVGNTEVTVTGTVTYTYSRYSQQCGLNYYSSSSRTIKSVTSVKVRIIDYFTNYSSGYDDTVTFNASSNQSSSCGFHGTLTASSGTTYSF